MPRGEASERRKEAGVRRRWRSRRLIVRDGSMLPDFAPGDRLLIDPRPARPLRAGDVVALRDPEHAGRLLLKRVVRLGPDVPGGDPALAPGTVFVEGDNRSRSRDSRRFGPVPRPDVVGIVWFRYAPSARRGPVGPRHA